MADWKDAIVLITSGDPANHAFGTGFIFHRDGTSRSFVLTCLHVVEDVEKASRDEPDALADILIDGEIAEVWVRGNKLLDLAVLAVDGLTGPALPLGSRVARHSVIETAGYTEHEAAHGSVLSRSLAGTVMDNNPVKSRRHPGRPGAWSLDIAIEDEPFRALTEGYSGSPVIDPKSGIVVGIMNLRWWSTKGHAVCVESCSLFEPPLSQRLPDYPPSSHLPAPAERLELPWRAEGALDWLASMIDHSDPVEQVARYLDDCAQTGKRASLCFCAIDACVSDCPHALAEHLAVQFGAVSDRVSQLDDLVTELYPKRWDRRGLWNALVDHITPPGQRARDAADPIDRVVHWINAGPSAGPHALRVVYCTLSMTDRGKRVPAFIDGAMRDFGSLQGLRPDARVLFLFACVFEEAGLKGMLSRLWPRRLGRSGAHQALGELRKLTQLDVEGWLQQIGQPVAGRWRLDGRTRQALRDELDRIFPNDAARIRYRKVRYPALKVLAEASLVES